MFVCVCLHTVHMQKYCGHCSGPQPPVPTCSVGIMLPWQLGLCHRPTRRCGDTWEDSCHLGQLMTSSQQGQALTRATPRINLSQLTDWQLEGFKHREKQSDRKIKRSKPVRINKLKGRSFLGIIPKRKHLDCLWNPLYCLYNTIREEMSHGRRRVIQSVLIIILDSAITRGSFICIGLKKKAKKKKKAAFMY